MRPGKKEQPGPEASQVKEAAAEKGTVEHTRQRPPRRDWAGLLRWTFALDVFVCCRCGGRRRVLAWLTYYAPHPLVVY